MENNENMIEFISGQRSITVTLTYPPDIKKIQKLHEERPNDFNYYVENDDGSICFKVPKKWLKIRPPRTRNLTDEQRQELAERLKKARRD